MTTIPMQYLGNEYTLVAQKGSREKVKVVNGEIIDVEEKDVARFRVGGFQVVGGDGKVSGLAQTTQDASLVVGNKPEEAKTDADEVDAGDDKNTDVPHVADADDFNKDELIAIAVKNEIDLWVNEKGKAISTSDKKDVIVTAFGDRLTQEILDKEYAEKTAK